MMKIMFPVLFLLLISKKGLKSTSLIVVFSVFLWLFSYSNHINSNLGYGMGADKVSGLLCLLSGVIMLVMMISSNLIWLNHEKEFFYMLLLSSMLGLLYLIFTIQNLLWFYIMFEIILIPLFLMIWGWGYQTERTEAGLYLMFYTLFGSLPLMLGILMLLGEMSLNFFMIENFSLSLLWSVLFLGAFLIKLPMFLLHYWLPKAHVEAPVAGSMILAGVLLKLGGYGIIRVYPLMSKLGLSNYMISLGVIGGVITSLSCLVQVDIKALIAYSSIGHMGLVLGGIFSGSMIGWEGGIMMMVAHGLCSSGLFCLMNFIYERTHTRSLMILRGFITLSPGATLCLFLLLSSNMSAPPSLSLVSEILLSVSLVNYYLINMFMLFFMFMLCCMYSLYLYSLLTHNMMSMLYGFLDLNQREYLLMMMHWLPLNLYFLKCG